jgi:hypothetical protein
MVDKKTILVRFYPDTDADLIAWLEDLAAGRGNENIKAMIRAGILTSQGHAVDPGRSPSNALAAALDEEALQSALERILPRIREIVDASLASVCMAASNHETPPLEENRPSAELLKGHLLSEDEAD